MIEQEQEDEVQCLESDHEVVRVPPRMCVLNQNPRNQGHDLGND